jgi:hypothetical protein
MTREDGMAIPLALFFLVITSLLGLGTYQNLKGDINDTGLSAKKAKSYYVAEAAAYMGLGIIQQPAGSRCVTHKPDETTLATDATSCKFFDLSKFEAIYPAGGVKYDASTGWLTNAAADTTEALTAAGSEKIALKIWQPTPATIRVVARADVKGTVADIQLFGEWRP